MDESVVSDLFVIKHLFIGADLSFQYMRKILPVLFSVLFWLGKSLNLGMLALKNFRSLILIPLLKKNQVLVLILVWKKPALIETLLLSSLLLFIQTNLYLNKATRKQLIIH